MNYITVTQASFRWGISKTRITVLAKNGRIDGAVKMGNSWMIPENAEKPSDARTKASKEEKKDSFFRFPLYLNAPENGYVPALSAEEKALRQAQIDLFDCEFAKADKALEYLSEHAKSIYVKLGALTCAFILSTVYKCGEGTERLQFRIKAILSSDFLYQEDMKILLAWLYANTGQYKMVSKTLNVCPAYDYSPSVCGMISYLSVFHYADTDVGDLVPIHYDNFEIACRQLEKDGYYYEAHELHFTLFVVYYMIAKEESAEYHLKRALKIANEHHFILIASCYFGMYPDIFKKALCDFPTDFAKTVESYSASVLKNFSVFTSSHKITELYTYLSKKDYRYILFATQGFSNKQVAEHMKVSERTVANRYSEIYEKFGISSKQELLGIVEDCLTEK